MLNLDSIVSYREDIDTTDIDEDKVMMDLEKGQYFALNSVGSRIWEEIQSPVKISEVVNILLSEYDVDRETCEKSVMEFIEGLDNAAFYRLIRKTKTFLFKISMEDKLLFLEAFF